jgi:hypothetical protein
MGAVGRAVDVYTVAVLPALEMRFRSEWRFDLSGLKASNFNNMLISSSLAWSSFRKRRRGNCSKT